MKFTRKVLSMVLVLVLIAMPMAAFAEGIQTTTTIDNIEVALNGGNPIALNIQLQGVLGTNGDNSFVQADVQSEGDAVAHVNVAMQGKTIQAHVDGIEGVFEVTEDEIADYMKKQMGGTEMPFDSKVMTDYLTAYFKLMSKVGELEKEPMKNSVEMFEAIGIPMEGKEEAAEVFGEQMDLTRYDFTFGLPEMDKLLTEISKQIPELQEYMDAYINFLASVASMDPSTQKLDFDKNRPFESLTDSVGGAATVKVTMWTDADEKNYRMEMVVSMTEQISVSVSEEEGETTETIEPVTIEMPITVQAMTDEDGAIHMKMDSDVTQDGMTMKMDLESKGTDVKGDFNFDIAVDDATQPVQMKLTGDYDKGSFNGQLEVEAEGMKVTVALASQEDGDVSHVQFSAVVDTTDGTPMFSAVLSFDVKLEEAAMPEGTLLSDESTVKNVFKMSGEERQQLLKEATEIGTTAMGSLMSNSGVVQLIGEVVSMVSGATESDDQPEVGTAA